MKYILFTVLTLGIVSCNKKEGEIPCIPDNLENNLLAFYPFSNGSILDISGNGHHLTNNTNASSGVDRGGNANCAYTFDNQSGNAEFISTTSTNFLNNLDELSISLWYRADSLLSNQTVFESLVSRDSVLSCPNRYGQWSLSLYDCRKPVFGSINSVWAQNMTNFDCQQETSLRTNIWTHLTATYNSNTLETKLYVNGVLQSTDSGVANCGSGTVSIQDIGDLILGKQYSGSLDDVMLFNKILDQTEIDEIANLETCCSSIE